MRYPATLKYQKDAGTYAVGFPDIPEAITVGDTESEALRHAVDALETALDFYFDYKREVPEPSRAKVGQRLIDLPASVAAKILLHNEMIAQQVRPAELARRMKIPRQEMTRLLDPRHTTKIDSIALALSALGKRLELSVL